jgi:hypothetical protein
MLIQQPNTVIENNQIDWAHFYIRKGKSNRVRTNQVQSAAQVPLEKDIPLPPLLLLLRKPSPATSSWATPAKSQQEQVM